MDNKQSGCPEFPKIYRLINTTAAIPKVFLEHVKDCKQCRTYLSFLLAANKSSAEVRRIKFASGCEHKNFATRLIELIVEFIETADLVTKPEEKQNFPYILTELYIDPDWCPLCKMYFGIIREQTFLLQKEYLEAIKAGLEIRPVVGKMPPETTVGMLYRNPNPNTKPN